jgi:hypothetical protein
MQALAVANGVRAYRAQLRADLKRLKRDDGAYYCSIVIEDNAPEVRTMPVEKLLDMVRYMSRARSHRVFVKAMVGGHRSIGGLTPRQREALISVLREPGQ